MTWKKWVNNKVKKSIELFGVARIRTKCKKTAGRPYMVYIWLNNTEADEIKNSCTMMHTVKKKKNLNFTYDVTCCQLAATS